MNIKRTIGIAVLACGLTAGLSGLGTRVEAYPGSSVGPTGVGTIHSSTDGRYVAFSSTSTTLVSGDTNNRTDAFVLDTELNTTERVNVSSSGSQSDENVQAIRITGNGRYIAFVSTDEGLVSPSTNGGQSIYVRDTKLDITQLAISGFAYTYNMDLSSISEDGRFVYYTKWAATGDVSVHAHDMAANTDTRLDVSGSSTANDDSYYPDSSCDGRFVVFESYASNLVSGDTNGHGDIFLLDRMGNTLKNITLGADSVSEQPEITCDGNYVIFGSAAGNLVSSDNNNERDLFRYSVSDESIEMISLMPNGSQFGDAFSAGGAVSTSSSGHDTTMDGRYVVFGSNKTGSPNSGRLYIRDVESGVTTAYTPTSPSYASSPSFSYDGNKLYYNYSTYGSGTGTLHVSTDFLSSL